MKTADLIELCIIALKDKGNAEIKYHLATDNWAYLTLNGLNFLAFYGTDTLVEWLDNLNFLETNPEGFHMGWAKEAFKAIFAKGNFKIDYIIGYSRGAAIGLIAAYYMPHKCVAFNAPRVSNTLRYWAKIPVLVHALNDPVTKMPPGFYHPGNNITMAIRKGGHTLKPNMFKELQTGDDDE